jgi:hypothetical protein
MGSHIKSNYIASYWFPLQSSCSFIFNRAQTKVQSTYDEILNIKNVQIRASGSYNPVFCSTPIY